MSIFRRASRSIVNLLGADLLTRSIYRICRFGEGFGVHVLPVHFYSPVPRFRELARHKSNWCKRSDMPGINADIRRQADTLMEICLPFQHEYTAPEFFADAETNNLGTGYGHIEAQTLYSVVRYHKPTTIVEVGSGLSTSVSAAAATMNAADGAEACRIICIEPYPRPALERMSGIELIKKQVQEIPPEFFVDNLKDGGLLFVDSSHVVRPGGDVNHLYLEVLPRLGGGTLFHAHDTNYPFDYDRALLYKAFGCFRTEPSLLRALMINNDRIEVLLSLSMLHYDEPEQLSKAFPGYLPQSNSPTGLASPREDVIGRHFPSSIWLTLQ